MIVPVVAMLTVIVLVMPVTTVIVLVMPVVAVIVPVVLVGRMTVPRKVFNADGDAQSQQQSGCKFATVVMVKGNLWQQVG